MFIDIDIDIDIASARSMQLGEPDRINSSQAAAGQSFNFVQLAGYPGQVCMFSVFMRLLVDGRRFNAAGP